MTQTRPSATCAAAAVLLLIALSPAALCFAQEKANPPAQKADLSSPKAAANEFADAMLAGDVIRTKSVCTGNEKQMKIVEAMVGPLGAIRKLEEALVARYGQEAVKKAGQRMVSADVMNDSVKRLRAGEVTVTGDTAVVTPQKRQDAPAEPADPLPLKKVGAEWKVDLAALTKGIEGSEEQMEALQAATTMLQGVTKEVASGKYKTAEDANKGINDAVMKMAKEQEAKQQAKQPPPKQEAKPGEKERK